MLAILVASIVVITNHTDGLNTVVKSDELKGEWRIDEITSFTFDGNGKGVLHTDRDDHIFDYCLKDNIIIMDFNNVNIENPQYKYEIKDNQLVLKSSDKQYLLTKQT